MASRTSDTLEARVRLRINELMAQRGLSLSELARLSRIEIATLQKLLALQRDKQRGLTLKYLEPICQALGCQPAELFSPEAPLAPADGHTAEWTIAYLRRWAHAEASEMAVKLADLFVDQVRAQLTPEAQADALIEQLAAHAERRQAEEQKRKPGRRRHRSSGTDTTAH